MLLSHRWTMGNHPISYLAELIVLMIVSSILSTNPKKKFVNSHVALHITTTFTKKKEHSHLLQPHLAHTK